MDELRSWRLLLTWLLLPARWSSAETNDYLARRDGWTDAPERSSGKLA